MIYLNDIDAFLIYFFVELERLVRGDISILLFWGSYIFLIDFIIWLNYKGFLSHFLESLSFEFNIWVEGNHRWEIL